MPLISTHRLRRLLIVGVPIGALVALVYAVAMEVQSSRLQAMLFARLARELTFKLEAGPTDDIRFPGPGPYDTRLGYQQLPTLIKGLTENGFEVTAQARMSPRLLTNSERGLSPTYREKDQAGLEVLDCRNKPLFRARTPERVYEHFEAVPPLLVDTLLFIENRGLLDARYATLNPALDWDRLSRAVLDRTWHLVDRGHASPGGSTLATQIEKFRHSPQGRTESIGEKLRQMTSASLRAYIDGEDTTQRRQQIVLSYANSVPLAAKAGFGEVSGLGDGLWAWFGRDFTDVNALLMSYRRDEPGEAPLHTRRRAMAFREAVIFRQAQAYKQALSLMIAQRRPSHYLADGAPSLGTLTDSYLRIMADAGVISPQLRDAALPMPLALKADPVAVQPNSFVEHKAATAVRATLARLLDTPRSYDLDRFDLSARSSIDGDAQDTATHLLRSLRESAGARAAGLYGFHLLNDRDDPGKLSFSVTLLERGDSANLVRVQTDSGDHPFDINEGARLDLGSTAKLRTLITYLEVVAEFHGRWSGLDGEALARQTADANDPIGRWARDYLSRASDRRLATMLDAAMQRSYSASPAEAFFTGGGLHRFVNFEPQDNGRVLTVREALARSVNLVFIRLMRELVHHYMFGTPRTAARLLDDQTDPRRMDYLARFADKEGGEFLSRFYAKYRGRSPQQAEDLLLNGVRATPRRLASLLFGLEPQAGVDRLRGLLARQSAGAGLPERSLRGLYDSYGPGRLTLADRSFVAGVHPLELWLVGFLRSHPESTLGDALAASRDQRQEVYGWLFKTGSKTAQDMRIRSMLELDAFGEIQRAWQRLGYPFGALTPSYATAIGASGDRPSALAELMGIVVNQGLRLPVTKLESLEFARDTPFETRLGYRPALAQRVLPEEVAAIVRRSLVDVVRDGTARRLRGALARPDGSDVEIGGKTGTGDHRFDVHGVGGRLVSTRVVDRSASFVFFIGDRFFGTVMVYAHEPYAANYRFTSALPAQLLKALLPVIMPASGTPRTGRPNLTHATPSLPCSKSPPSVSS